MPGTRDLRSERGSILVLTTLLLPALVAVGAVAIGSTTLWAGRLDAQRSVDLAALAGAANTPTASIDSSSVGLPFGIDGLTATLDMEVDAEVEADGPVATDMVLGGDTEIGPIGVALPEPSWRDRPCQVLRAQLNVGRSAVLNASKTSGLTCTKQWTYESKTLAALAACVRDELDVQDCDARLRNRLSRTLPALDASSPAATAAMDDLEDGIAGLTDSTNVLLTASWQQAIETACLVPPLPLVGGCPLTIADQLLTQTADQLAAAGRSPTGDLLPYVDPRRLAPAALTPLLKVRLTGGALRPMLSPFTFDLDAAATARRTIKRAIVLPSLGLGDPDGDSFLPDPDDIAKASTAVDATERLLDLVDTMDRFIGKHVVDAFLGAVCEGEYTGEATSAYCPQMDGVVATKDLQDIFMQDLRDATAPQPDGPTLGLQDSLDDLAASGDPTWAVAPLRAMDFRAFLAAAGLKQAEITSLQLLNPALAPLFQGVVQIPAFDVVPVTVRKLSTGDPTRPQYVFDVINAAGATSGLYQARLVK